MAPILLQYLPAFCFILFLVPIKLLLAYLMDISMPFNIHKCHTDKHTHVFLQGEVVFHVLEREPWLQPGKLNLC